MITITIIRTLIPGLAGSRPGLSLVALREEAHDEEPAGLVLGSGDLSISIYLHLSLSLYLSIYLSIFIYTHIYIYIL